MQAGDVENLLDDKMGAGIYQLGVLIMAFLFSFVATDSFAINFIAGKMDHACAGMSQTIPSYAGGGINHSDVYPYPPNGSYYMGKCAVQWVGDNSSSSPAFEYSSSLTCSSWEYDKSEFTSTIVSEFDLVCWRGWLVDLVSTFYMAGRLFACLSHGYFSDRYGRKKVLIGSHVLKLIGGVMSLYSPNFLTFAVSRFIIAVGSTASCMASFVLLVESVGRKWRGRLGILFNISPALGGMLLPLVAYLIRDYRALQAVYTWPQFILCLCYFVLSESPKWLEAQKREEATIKVMKKIAVVNDKVGVLEEFLNKIKSIEKMALIQGDNRKSNDEKSSFSKGLFGNKVLARKTLILWMCWFVAALIYYAISLNTGRLPGSIYLNTFLLTIIEIPANFLTIVAMEKFGGRKTLGSFTGLAGVASFLMIPLMFNDDYRYLVTSLGILGKGLITVSYNAIYVETAETYPTKIRSQAMGISASFGRLSSMASSFLGGFMADLWKPLPNLIFGSLALISGTLFIVFPTIHTGDMVSRSRNGRSLSSEIVKNVPEEKESLA